MAKVTVGPRYGTPGSKKVRPTGGNDVCLDGVLVAQIHSLYGRDYTFQNWTIVRIEVVFPKGVFADAVDKVYLVRERLTPGAELTLVYGITARSQLAAAKAYAKSCIPT
jgi:hypothetical protein